MNSRCFFVAVVVFIAAAGGSALNRMVVPAWPEVRGGEPAPDPESIRLAGGPAWCFALLGGYRALAADFAWLRLHQAWERRDWVTTNTLLHLVCTLDPRPLYFWINGARIIAYDFAAWRSAGPGNDPIPRVRDEFRREQARAALRFLTRAEAFHSASPRLWIERAGIELHGGGDFAAAAASYRRAAELPGCPLFAARLHARLLCRLDRTAEARAWLVRVHRELPPGEDADLIQDWIRDLEPRPVMEKAIQPPGDR